ncbi:MAG: hypothetical protein DDT24_00919 [Chloroflexi bacterium]|nr:hypothetical protein [Chloroflexota bacterium]
MDQSLLASRRVYHLRLPRAPEKLAQVSSYLISPQSRIGSIQLQDMLPDLRTRITLSQGERKWQNHIHRDLPCPSRPDEVGDQKAGLNRRRASSGIRPCYKIGHSPEQASFQIAVEETSRR